MDEKIDKMRRALITGGPAALILGSRATRVASEEKVENSVPVSVERLEMSPESIDQAVRDTVTSLEKGISKIHGRNVSPRDSGFTYHPQLLNHYAKGLELPEGLSRDEKVDKVRKSLTERIKIFPVSSDELKLFEEQEACEDLQKLSSAMRLNEIGACVYLSEDRSFQRIYAARKTGPETLRFLESYSDSTSRKEPEEPRRSYAAAITPLGLFSIPTDGVRLALPGEVTKVERRDTTRHFFTPLNIDGKTRYFVKNFNKSADDEIVTVTGDTHLLWSPEIEGRGIKIHDTTEIDEIGKPASSGCIRTPSARRFTLMTLENKYPTQVVVHWAGYSKWKKEHGFGGVFGGEPIIERRGKRK